MTADTGSFPYNMTRDPAALSALAAVALDKSRGDALSFTSAAASTNLVASGLNCDTNGPVTVIFRMKSKGTGQNDVDLGVNGGTTGVDVAPLQRVPGGGVSGAAGTCRLSSINYSGGREALNMVMAVTIRAPQSAFSGAAVTSRAIEVIGWCWDASTRRDEFFFGAYTGSGEIVSIGLYGSLATGIDAGSSVEVKFSSSPLG
jgi:hypothetical protein